MKRLEEFLSTQHNLSASTKESYRKAVKAFDKAIKDEFEDSYLDSKIVHVALNKIQKNYAEGTWNTWLTCMKRYAKWLSDPDDTDTPKIWKKIKPIQIDWEEKLKNKWLSEAEFSAILDKVDYARDKAMYGVAVEGALRPGELLGLTIGNCKPASYGFDVTVSGKTGTGSFPVVLFAPLLRQWLNLHPNKKNPEASLWPTKRNVHNDCTVSESQFMATIDFKRYAKEAGITRPISLHILRHTKISWTAKSTEVGVSDEMAKKMFRWGKNSRMYSRYSHLFGVDSNKTYLALAGVKQESEIKSSILVRRKCFSCGEENSADALYCFRCGSVLDQEQAIRIVKEREMMDYFMKRYMEEQRSKK